MVGAAGRAIREGSGRKDPVRRGDRRQPRACLPAPAPPAAATTKAARGKYLNPSHLPEGVDSPCPAKSGQTGPTGPGLTATKSPFRLKRGRKADAAMEDKCGASGVRARGRKAWGE